MILLSKVPRVALGLHFCTVEQSRAILMFFLPLSIEFKLLGSAAEAIVFTLLVWFFQNLLHVILHCGLTWLWFVLKWKEIRETFFRHIFEPIISKIRDSFFSKSNLFIMEIQWFVLCHRTTSAQCGLYWQDESWQKQIVQCKRNPKGSHRILNNVAQTRQGKVSCLIKPSMEPGLSAVNTLEVALKEVKEEIDLLWSWFQEESSIALPTPRGNTFGIHKTVSAGWFCDCISL